MVDEKIWQVLDSHAARIAAQETEIAVIKSRTSTLEKGHVDVCEQLKDTEREVMASQNEIKKDVLLILAELNQMKGAKRAVAWIPTLIQVCVGLTVLYAVMTRV